MLSLTSWLWPWQKLLFATYVVAIHGDVGVGGWLMFAWAWNEW